MLSNTRSDRSQQAKRGITLLELLIVMVILLMVTAAAIPVMAPALRNRQMREATRLVSAYLGAARARSVQTGRPVGVMVERFDGNAFALQLSQVEVPPPYSGDINNAVAQVSITSPVATAGETPNTAQSLTYFNSLYNSVTHTMSAVWFVAQVDPTVFNNRLVRVGDRIQFGQRGYTYTIYGPDTTPADGVIDSTGGPINLDIAYVYPDNAAYTRSLTPARPLIDNVRFPWETAPPLPVPQPVSYRIFRQPVRTTAPPLVLPDGIVIDLSVSQAGSDFFNSANYNIGIGVQAPDPIVLFDPVILFSPSGRLDYVTNKAGQLARPLGPVNLLMGRRELMFDVTAKKATPPNNQDLVFQNLSPVAKPTSASLMPPAENFWMTIGYQTGQVSVSQVAPHYQDYDGVGAGGMSAPSTQDQVIDRALNGGGTALGAMSFAKESQSLGGR
jgi:prepilin-type N-terminal cleavage/methylation domain-containing protein